MWGKIFLVEAAPEYPERAQDRSVQSLSVCVRGLHIRYLVFVTYFAGEAVNAQVCDRHVYRAPCKGSCREDNTDIRCEVRSQDREDDPDSWQGFEEYVRKFFYEPRAMGRLYHRSIHDDGDGETRLICCGSAYHVRGVCTEYGMGYGYQVVGPCDLQTCRPRRIRLPKSIERRVKQVLNERRNGPVVAGYITT